MRVHFVDTRQDFVDAATAEFADVGGVEATCGGVEGVARCGTAFVSPANGLGFMDGGVDFAYSRRMFPGVEARVKAAIRALGTRTRLGRPYQPVGSALVVPAGPGCVLVSAPTMFLPHDVSRTRNAYHAFMAAMMAARKIGAERLVCPGLCCGVGGMTPRDSARQIRRAFDDFVAGRTPPETRDLGAGYVVTASRDDEQPDNFDNREIKDVPLASLCARDT